MEMETTAIKRVVSEPLEEHRFIVRKLFEAVSAASRYVIELM